MASRNKTEQKLQQAMRQSQLFKEQQLKAKYEDAKRQTSHQNQKESHRNQLKKLRDSDESSQERPLGSLWNKMFDGVQAVKSLSVKSAKESIQIINSKDKANLLSQQKTFQQKSATKNESPQFQLKYEKMPKVESPELDSARLTVDLEHDQQPKKQMKITETDFEENKSNITIRTTFQLQLNNSINQIEQPQNKTKFSPLGPNYENSAEKNLMNFDESVVTSMVLKSARVKLQDEYQEADVHQMKQPSEMQPSSMTKQIFQQDQGATLSSFELGKNILPTERKDIQISQKVLFQEKNHEHSQSLDQLPNLAVDIGMKKVPGQPQNLNAQQIVFKSEINEVDEIQDSIPSFVQPETKFEPDTLRLRNNLHSEFAETDQMGAKVNLVSSMHLPENSMTIQEGLNISEYGAQTVHDSVTDRNYVYNAAQEVEVQHVHQDSIGGALVSATDLANSHIASMNPKNSDRIDLGTFQEENSSGWKRNPLPVDPQAPLIEDKLYQSMTQEEVEEATVHNLEICKESKEEQKSNSSDSHSIKQKSIIQVLVSEDQKQHNQTDSSIPKLSQDDEIIKMTEPNLNDSLHVDNQQFQQEETEIVEKNYHLGSIMSNSPTRVIEIGGSQIECHSLEQQQNDAGIQKQVPEYQNEERQFYTSIQHTSVTREAPLASHGVCAAQPNSPLQSDYLQDSMAFDTVLVQENQSFQFATKNLIQDEADNELSVQVQSVENTVSQKNEVSIIEKESIIQPDGLDIFGGTQQSIKQPLDYEVGEIFVQRDDEVYQIDRKDDIDEGTLPQAIETTNDDLKEEKSLQELEELPDFSKNIMSKTQREEINNHSQPELTQESPLKLNSLFQKTEQTYEGRRSTRRKRHQSNEKGSIRQSNQDLKSSYKVGNSCKSPRGSVKSKSKSNSPPRSKIIRIKDGKLVNTARKNQDVNLASKEQQFPIRKSNYDNQTVQSMLLNMDQFRSSIEMVRKMKNRISQYNKDIVPVAQQFYYAKQQEQTQFSSRKLKTSTQKREQNFDDFEQNPAVDVSVQCQQSIQPEQPSRLATNPTEKHRAVDAFNQGKNMGLNQADLQQFLRQASLAKHHQLSQWTDQESFNNDDLGEKTQDHNLQNQNQSSYTIDPNEAGQEVTRKETEPFGDDLEGKFNQFMAQEIPNSRQGYPQQKLGNQAQQQLKHKQEIIKKQNKRLIFGDNGLVRKQSVNKLQNQDALSQQNVGFLRQDNQNERNTRSSFQYPQDNLSQLLHPKSSYLNNQQQLQGGTQKNMINVAHLGIQFKIPQRSRQMQKNRTIEKIYSKSNAKNLLQSIGAYPNMRQQSKNSEEALKQRAYEIIQNGRSDDVEEPPMEDQGQNSSFQKQKMTWADNTGEAQTTTLGMDSSQPSFRQINPDENMREIMQQSKTSLNLHFKPHQSMLKSSEIPQSVQDKFHKWLGKSRASNGAYSKTPILMGSRNESQQMNKSARVTNNFSARDNKRFNNQSPDFTPNQTNKSFNMGSQQQYQYTYGGEQRDDKLNLSKALQSLKVPRSNVQTLEQRKTWLVQHLNQQQNLQNQGQDVQYSFIGQNNIYRESKSMVGVNRYAAQGEDQTVKDKQNNLELGQFLALDSSNQLQTLPQMPNIQLRNSLQPQERLTLDKTMREIATKSFRKSQVNNLHNTFAVTHQKRRADFLKNNYTKNAFVYEAHKAHNKKLLENRKSKSPNPQNSTMADVKNSLDSTVLKNSARKAKAQNIGFQRAHLKQDTRQKNLSHASGATNSSATTGKKLKGIITKNKRLGAVLSPRDAEKRHQMHVLNLDTIEKDTYEHPPISLTLQAIQNQESEDVQKSNLVEKEDHMVLDEDKQQVVDGLISVDEQYSYEQDQQDESIKDVQQVLPMTNLTSQEEDSAGAVNQGTPQMNQQTSPSEIANATVSHIIVEQENDVQVNQDEQAAEQETAQEDQDDGYEEEFETESQKLGRDKSNSKEQQDHEEEQESEEDDDYYADDKFVYEDAAEEPSSEDPEQKFLKEHALLTARESDTVAEAEEEEVKQAVITSADDEDLDISLKSCAIAQQNRRTSQSLQLSIVSKTESYPQEKAAIAEDGDQFDSNAFSRKLQGDEEDAISSVKAKQGGKYHEQKLI